MMQVTRRFQRAESISCHFENQFLKQLFSDVVLKYNSEVQQLEYLQYGHLFVHGKNLPLDSIFLS